MNSLAPSAGKISHDENVSSAFTLIELLLVIAILLIIATLSSPFLSRFVARTNHAAVSDQLVGSIRKAQAYAMDGKATGTWGVCRSGDEIILFNGSCSTPTFSESFTIPASVTVSGLNTITFNSRGEPDTSVTLNISIPGKSRTIQLNRAGGMLITHTFFNNSERRYT